MRNFKSIFFVIGLSLLFSSFTLFKSGEHTPSTSAESGCKIKFVGLKCIVTEGNASADKIYFKINGEKWPDNDRLSMTAGKYYDLEGYVDYNFSNSVTVELWDDDMFDPDDLLGKVTISCSYESDGVARFTQDGANYKLYYKVN